jgi:two-component system sporulation sensor kinase B
MRSVDFGCQGRGRWLFGIEQLLLNILFIILSIFCFQVFWGEQAYKDGGWKKQVIIGVFASGSLILCMIFPFKFLPGYIFDMRAVPLLLGTLYGGYKVGIFSLFSLILFRYYSGGDGFYTSLYVYPLISLAAIYLLPLFQRVDGEGKRRIGMWLALLASVLVIVVSSWRLSYLGKLHIDFFQFSLGYIFIQISGVWIAVYLIENMRRQLAMQSEIQRAEKLYAMGELAASVAHEIRNPLTAVRGFLQLLGQQQISEEKKQEYVRIMTQELDRAEEIISDYLTFAKPHVEKREQVNVGQQIHQVVSVMSSYALLKKVEIHTEVEDELWLTLNRSKFSQCLMNLMKNGVEAMPEGGTLHVRAFRRNEEIIIDVIDTGKGMSQEEVERLGNPFYSTKEKGTGLGLMVCYRIVEAWNGKVKVESEKGKGTHFSIIFPIAS